MKSYLSWSTWYWYNFPLWVLPSYPPMMVGSPSSCSIMADDSGTGRSATGVQAPSLGLYISAERRGGFLAHQPAQPPAIWKFENQGCVIKGCS